MKRIARNERKFRESAEMLSRFPGSRSFCMDMLYSSGEIYKLPFIGGAGDLSNNCYYRPIENGFELYRMNGYIQLFYREVNGICEVNNDWMPYTYTKVVLEYLRSL